MAASPRICATDMRPTGSTTPIQFRPCCFCAWMPMCAVRSNAAAARAAPAPRDRTCGRAFPRADDELLDADRVEHVFQPRLVAIGAVAVLDENPHHRIGDLAGVLRLDEHAGIAGKVAMPGDAAQAQLEPDAGREARALVHLHRLKADVVGVFQHRDGAGAVEGDVEFARQAVKRAIVENVKMPFARERAGVDQFLRIDAGGRRAGDIADIVGAGAARAQSEILNRLDHRHRVVRFNLADLQIGAGRDMGVAAAIALGEIGNAGELRRLEDPVRDAQAAHIRILVRRDIKQAEEAPAEIVGRLRIFVALAELLQALVAVERMLLALELFLIGKLLAGGEHTVLRFEGAASGPVGSGRRRGHLQPERRRRSWPPLAICTPATKPSR